MRPRNLRLVVAGVSVALGLALGAQWASHEPAKIDHPDVPAQTLAAASALVDGLPLADLDAQVQSGNLTGAHVHVALFSEGHRSGSGWGEADRVQGALALAYQAALADNGKQKKPRQATTALLSVAYRLDEVSKSNQRSLFSNVNRGVYGLSISSKVEGSSTPRLELHSPIENVISNRTLSKQLSLIAEDHKLKPDKMIADGSVGVIKARQFYVDLEHSAAALETLRGNVTVRMKDMTQRNLQGLAERMSRWMLDNVQPDGRMVYMYFPSRGEEAKGNNTIRQLMATICIGRIAKTGQFPGAQEIANRNLRYNLQTFYHDREGNGSIEYQGKSKLGAIALALIAIMESPIRGDLREQEQGLRRAIDHLWQPSGEFHTFLRPPDRNDNHNFYPGEALLAWAISMSQSPDGQIEKKFLQSFAYYKKWHLENRNPAFIPWHTQAYYLYWSQHQPAEMAEWILTMNDWLLGMQKRSRVAYDDTLGRFYDPQNPQFGPPHASSTGAYLEGLIDAFILARKLGDAEHQESYRRAILLGLRHAMQLEFADDLDLFYVSKRKAVQGGLRTTVYDNRIRVDNVQHVLMALQKVLQEFSPEDYREVKLD